MRTSLNLVPRRAVSSSVSSTRAWADLPRAAGRSGSSLLRHHASGPGQHLNFLISSARTHTTASRLWPRSLRPCFPIAALRRGAGRPMYLRCGLASQADGDRKDKAKGKAAKIDVDEMFGPTPDQIEEHWVRMTINDEWEQSEDPDVSEPADLHLAKYRGTLDEKGMPTGRGKLYTQDNQEGVSIYYFGDFKNGKFHGKGRSVNIEHVDLTKEERAQLPKNIFQWTGQEKLLQLGTVYEGDWNEGEMHGKGRLSDPNSGHIYEGDFVSGQRTGKGKEITESSEYFYTGDFEDGAWHGKGILRSKGGDYFEGEFQRGTMQQGKGKTVEEDGFIYEGEIYDGEPHGYGKQYHPEKKEGYEGNWHHGEFSGQGKLTLDDGSSYEGTFVNGVLEGPVLFTDPTGKTENLVCKNGVPQ